MAYLKQNPALALAEFIAQFNLFFRNQRYNSIFYNFFLSRQPILIAKVFVGGVCCR